MAFGLVALLFLLTACGKNNRNDGIRGNAAPNGSFGNQGVVGQYPQKCANGQDAVGMIFDGGQALNFQNQVAAYVSSWMDPNQLGTVDGSASSTQTGIDLMGKLKFNSAGAIIRESSGLEISIIDSNYLQGNQKISVANYNQKAVNGQMNYNTRNFEASFQDQYGMLKIAGQFDQNFAWGQISFSNTRSVNSAIAPQSGTLGAFRITRCGLLD